MAKKKNLSVRLPKALREQLVSAAKANKRSINGEINHRLCVTLAHHDIPKR